MRSEATHEVAQASVEVPGVTASGVAGSGDAAGVPLTVTLLECPRYVVEHPPEQGTEGFVPLPGQGWDRPGTPPPQTCGPRAEG